MPANKISRYEDFDAPRQLKKVLSIYSEFVGQNSD